MSGVGNQIDIEDIHVRSYTVAVHKDTTGADETIETAWIALRIEPHNVPRLAGGPSGYRMLLRAMERAWELHRNGGAVVANIGADVKTLFEVLRPLKPLMHLLHPSLVALVPELQSPSFRAQDSVARQAARKISSAYVGYQEGAGCSRQPIKADEKAIKDYPKVYAAGKRWGKFFDTMSYSDDDLKRVAAAMASFSGNTAAFGTADDILFALQTSDKSLTALKTLEVKPHTDAVLVVSGTKVDSSSVASKKQEFHAAVTAAANGGPLVRAAAVQAPVPAAGGTGVLSRFLLMARARQSTQLEVQPPGSRRRVGASLDEVQAGCGIPADWLQVPDEADLNIGENDDVPLAKYLAETIQTFINSANRAPNGFAILARAGVQPGAEGADDNTFIGARIIVAALQEAMAPKARYNLHSSKASRF